MRLPLTITPGIRRNVSRWARPASVAARTVDIDVSRIKTAPTNIDTFTIVSVPPFEGHFPLWSKK